MAGVLLVSISTMRIQTCTVLTQARQLSALTVCEVKDMRTISHPDLMFVVAYQRAAAEYHMKAIAAMSRGDKVMAAYYQQRREFQSLAAAQGLHYLLHPDAQSY